MLLRMRGSTASSPSASSTLAWTSPSPAAAAAAAALAAAASSAASSARSCSMRAAWSHAWRLFSTLGSSSAHRRAISTYRSRSAARARTRSDFATVRSSPVSAVVAAAAAKPLSLPAAKTRRTCSYACLALLRAPWASLTLWNVKARCAWMLARATSASTQRGWRRRSVSNVWSACGNCSRRMWTDPRPRCAMTRSGLASRAAE